MDRYLIKIRTDDFEKYWNCKRKIDRAIEKLEETELKNRSRIKQEFKGSSVSTGELLTFRGSSDEIREEFEGRFHSFSIYKINRISAEEAREDE